MKKQTISRLAVGFAVVLFGALSISCWSYVWVNAHYSYMPDGEITLSELEDFDAYTVKDTFGDLSDEYVPVRYRLVQKKRNSNEQDIYYYRRQKSDKSSFDVSKNSIKHLHSLFRDSSNLFAIGDTLMLTLYYTPKESYDRYLRNMTDNGEEYSYVLNNGRYLRYQEYKIQDESLVELKREKDRRFKVYPSPAVDDVNVQVDISQSNPGKIMLFDQRGRVLEENETYDVTQNTKLELSSYPSGTYYVQVTFKGENFIKKIIKN